MTSGDGKPKAPGTWDWYGSLDPAHCHNWSSMVTFSIGIFQWISTKDGNASKKGKVLKRITGYVSNPEETYDKARAWIKKQEENEKSKPLDLKIHLQNLHKRIENLHKLSNDPNLKEIMDELSSIIKEQP